MAFDMKNTYWNHSGKHETEYQRITEKCLDPQDSCETVAGELIRASGKLYHDCHNNGMGNNTTGPINYLREMGVFTGDDGEQLWDIIYPFTNNRYAGDQGPYFDEAIEQMADRTIELILANPKFETLPNDTCMYDYEEPGDYSSDEDEDDEDEDDWEHADDC